ncbi:aldehyde dehydrogenase [Pusillimonas sp. T7-7]|uniref:aldehyde dehydrogenase family protein n=1 Tax=Pusillimonas sp. (strain T7-7) TaxID=1007105 RepID=UPI00020847B6|nr:aldehyde dehydrogenase family protein [Pusillimonas sp. T7-7]AEC21582.1 aldehyde dehydrogenase [Pusillimonas sp. T7-7]
MDASATLVGDIPVRTRYEHFIGGQHQAPSGGQYIEVENPSTGGRLTECARGNASDISKAVASAQQGYRAWRALKPLQRGRIMLRISHLLLDNLDSLAYLESLDTGKPLWVARADVETCARYFEYFGGAADKILGEVVPTTDTHITYSIREPYGVTGHIIPWNGPITQAGRGAAPALCAGNSVVLKPAEETSITTLELARLCIEAGMPAGVVNVVTGYGAEAGKALVDNMGVRRISFTGSVETGREVLHGVAERIIPVTVELGGKSPFIIFPDADLERAATLARKAFVFNTGQICSAGTRLLVHRSVQEKFAALLIDELKQVTIGAGTDNSAIGPVVSARQLERVCGYLDIGRQEGARLIYGGNKPSALLGTGGHFIEPALFVDVTNQMRIAREEIFGPVGVLIPFDDEEQAVAMANDNDFGLAAAVWTSDVGRAHRVAGLLEAGQVYVNDYQPVGVEAPFGGYKNSGFGREKGLAAIHDYTQLKTVIVYQGEGNPSH